MSTIALFLLSSVLYALVPVAILLFGDGKPQSALNVLAITVGFSCLFAGKVVTRPDYRAAFLDLRLVWMSLLQTIGFLGFLAFIFLAQDHSEALFTLIVAERMSRPAMGGALENPCFATQPKKPGACTNSLASKPCGTRETSHPTTKPR